MVYAEKIQSLAHLRDRIMVCCAAITPDTLNRVMEDWKNGLELCITEFGRHIEHTLEP